MSGIVGIITPSLHTAPHQFLKTAIEKMSHFNWYESATWVAPDQAVGLGRTGIGILNRNAVPLLSENGCQVVLMTGEFYDTQPVRRQIEQAGVILSNDSDAELALGAYKAFGPDFSSRLEGVFIIALYDQENRRLLLTNDRFGLYPTYYAQRGDTLIFAPEVKGVLADSRMPRKLNPRAAAEYFRFQHLLGGKTFHEDVHLFPPASIGVFDLNGGTWTMRRYWDWDQIQDQPDISFADAVVETGRLLRQSVARLTSDSLRPGVFLSGGLDSRTISGLIPPEKKPFVTATFGTRDCRDVYYAERIARVVGSNHHWFDLPDGRWVLDNVDFYLKLTEGFPSWIHMHGISMLPDLRGMIDYNLSGWNGGMVMCHNAGNTPLLRQPVDYMAQFVELYRRLTGVYTWPGMTEAEGRVLYPSAIRPQYANLAFDSLEDEFRPYEKYPANRRAEYFFQNNHGLRLTFPMVTTARSHIEARFPFFSYGLIDHIYSLPPEFRYNNRLYRHVITREIPQLSLVPFDKQEYLPNANRWLHTAHALSVRARRRLKLFPARFTLYADYENYLRQDLRQWAEDILFDGRTEARGLWDMAVVRSLVARHMSGQEEWTIGKIAPLITFEMMMRSYFDEE